LFVFCDNENQKTTKGENMKITNLLIAVLFAGSMAVAADAEKKEETTVDTSKNPITGTVTQKKKHKSKKKNGKNEKNVETTETTKTHSDGHTETKTDAEKH